MYWDWLFITQTYKILNMSTHNTTIYVIVHILSLLFHIFFTAFDFFNSEQTLYCRKKNVAKIMYFLSSQKNYARIIRYFLKVLLRTQTNIMLFIDLRLSQDPRRTQVRPNDLYKPPIARPTKSTWPIPNNFLWLKCLL